MIQLKQLFTLTFLFTVTNIYSQQKNNQQDTLKGLGDEVVVTGQYTPQPLKSSVYKVRSINEERIKMRAANDVVGVLNSELGIRFATDNSLGETDTKILGLGGTRVKILIDGIPLADRDATKQSISQIDINSVERIEIVEGPMSVIYGTDALAGVINIITKKGIKTGSNFSVGIKIREEGVYNTYVPFTKNGVHYENVSLSWNNNHWRSSAYLTRNNFGGFADTAAFPAKVFRPKKQWMTGGTLGYSKNNFDIWYRLDYLNEELLAASPMSLTTYKSFQQYYITNRFTHQLQSVWNINKALKLNTAISYQDYKRNTKSFTHDYWTVITTKNNTPEDLLNGYWDITPFKTFFARATLAYTISQKLSIQPGFDIKNDVTSGHRVIPNSSITDYSFLVSSEIKPTTFINIRPGIRITKNSKYSAPPFIPSLNTKFTLNKILDLRLSYARGFRAPILRELYFSFLDANHNIQGNPNLKAETSNSFMASLSCNAMKKKDVSITSSLTGFYNDYSDFIDMYDYVDNSGVTIFSYFNRDKFRTTGFTLDNTITWKNIGANIGASFIGYYNTYQENKNLDGNKSLYSWSPEITCNVTYKLQKINASVGFYYKFTGKVPTYSLDNSNDIILSKRNAFHWADVTATKQIFKQFTIQAGIKNLFDVGRIGSTAIGSSGIHESSSVINYAYGRSYFIGINFNWSKK